MENLNSKELTWFEAVTKYNSAMVTLENIRAIAGQSISLHKIRKFITRRESEREPDKKKFTDLETTEILEHVKRMESDIDKIYGFLRQNKLEGFKELDQLKIQKREFINEIIKILSECTPDTIIQELKDHKRIES